MIAAQTSHPHLVMFPCWVLKAAHCKKEIHLVPSRQSFLLVGAANSQDVSLTLRQERKTKSLRLARNSESLNLGEVILSHVISSQVRPISDIRLAVPAYHGPICDIKGKVAPDVRSTRGRATPSSHPRSHLRA